MAHETVQLAEYAAALRYEDLSVEVIACARIASSTPWQPASAAALCRGAGSVIDYASAPDRAARSRILGRGSAVQAAGGALANGALAHAFELDALTRPGPRASRPTSCRRRSPWRSRRASALAGGPDRRLCRRDNEYDPHRPATGTPRARGFHAPGTTGAVRAAVGLGHLLRLDAAKWEPLGFAGVASPAGSLNSARRRRHGQRCFGTGVRAGVSPQPTARFTGRATINRGESDFSGCSAPNFDERSDPAPRTITSR